MQLLIAVAAIYFVLNKIDFNKFIDKIFHIDLVYLALAFLAFNASKVLSAFRLNYFFRALGLSLQENYNLKLYYLGMLYNQVFPGGIGGDGYKVYLLNKLNKTTIKGLLAATLIDRISGVVALAFLSLLASLQSDNILALFGGYSFLIWIALILCFLKY